MNSQMNEYKNNVIFSGQSLSKNSLGANNETTSSPWVVAEGEGVVVLES